MRIERNVIIIMTNERHEAERSTLRLRMSNYLNFKIILGQQFGSPIMYCVLDPRTHVNRVSMSCINYRNTSDI